MNTSTKTGNQAENKAYQYLLKKGFTPITRNFNCRFGEIDLIMQDTESVIFVEVKFRTQHHFGSATEVITNQKQRKIIKTAHIFLQKNPHLYMKLCRFDTISITPQTIQWIKNAFYDTKF